MSGTDFGGGGVGFGTFARNGIYLFKHETERLSGGAVPKTSVGEGAAGEQAAPVEPSLSSIMSAIQTLGTTLETKIDKVSIEMNLLRADLNKTSDRAKTNETNIEDLQGRTKRLEQQVQQLVHQHRQVSIKLDDQEGRARRNNIRVVGVPEGREGSSVDLFLEELILNHLQPKRLSKCFTIERGHRAPIPPAQTGCPAKNHHRAPS